ncbi:hypothetical protein CLAFUR0_08719 [Fulvia fulva]|nr:hypothetical protein CLAFUR0_08719 [Fulvia fulva]
MAKPTISLDHCRIPSQPDKVPHLNGQPLQIIDNTADNTEDLSPAIGLATVLYNWCPDALYAFLDLESWFSFTWTLTPDLGEPSESKLEIGRIRNQITFGKLDNEGHWKLMIAYDLDENGIWHPNLKETMLDDADVTTPDQINRLAQQFASDLVREKRWLTGKKMKHEFFIEFAPVEDSIWDDGIAMSPHWLYKALDLNRCTTCDAQAGESEALSRCRRCGTAAYCSDKCQKQDWPVHKAVCSMSLDERGKALHLTKDGGLIRWVQAGMKPLYDIEET